MMRDPVDALRDPDRLAALYRTALLDTPAEEAFDRLTRLAARILKTPVSLVSLLAADRQFIKSCVGLPEPWPTRREAALSYSICQYAVCLGTPLVIEDARTHPLVWDNLTTVELGVAAYLGIPLITSDGQVLGSFCVMDTKPRTWTPEELENLKDLAASVLTEIEVRTRAREAERERIAMDLHDSVIQSLYAIGLALAAGEHTLDENTEKTRRVLLAAIERINTVIEEIRNCIFALSPEGRPRCDLRSGLQLITEELRVSAQIRTELRLEADVERLLDPDALINLLQIAREAVSNVVRHANAGQVRVSLVRSSQQIVLAIRDDGRGFVAEHADGWRGRGLRNMAARANAVGGRLAVMSQPGHGTEVRFEMPLPNRTVVA